MKYEETQPLRGRETDDDPRHVFRCPCGTDVDVDPDRGATCPHCQRDIPAAVTRFSLTMTIDNQTSLPRGDSQEQPDELIGKTLGHFQIIECIGRGGMGRVYRALDQSLQRYVAVKVIREIHEMEMDSVGQQRLMHEAVAQARVNHPNIVTIFYVGRDQGRPFMAMEWVDGYDASDLIRQGEIPYETLCSIALKITNALAVASELGIVHSDIKPQNLLVLKDGTVKLSDFGMARFAEQKQSTAVGGTPNYLAPELLRGGQPTIQSDMYALGVTLFELTFGRVPVPLSGSSFDDWSAVHEVAEIEFPEPWPDRLPERWRNVLSKLLEKDPANRYQSYEQLQHDLQQITPEKRPPALLLARAIAWLIDVVIIGLVAAVPIAVLAQQEMLEQMEMAEAIGELSLLPALALYCLLEYLWRQSIGRELVHIKIVNQYSLRPTRKTMLLRSVLRMLFLWWLVLAAIVTFASPFVGKLVEVSALIFPGIDLLYTIFVGRGQSLHDKITKTQAVVGSK